MFNNVTLIGYLGSDAESRTTRNNATLTILSLATKRTWKNRDTGAREAQTTWHKCVSFGRTSEYAAGLAKGAHVQIVGEIQTREYVAKDGMKKSVTEIRVQRIVRLDRAPKPESTEGGRRISGLPFEQEDLAMMTRSHREALILEHMPQVELLARRLHRRCPQAELDELVSAVTIGLIQAVDRFDPSRNLKLETLAEHRISGALLDDLCYIDPLPRNVRRFQKRRDAVIAELAVTGEVLSHTRIAESLGVSSKKDETLSRMIAAAEPISVYESTIAERRTG